MKMLRDDLELRRKQEIHEIEERKNTHINELMKKHEKAFADIKNYYNDITHNNLDLIKTLKVYFRLIAANALTRQPDVYEVKGLVLLFQRKLLCPRLQLRTGTLQDPSQTP